jgi:hypothetical protein
MNFSENAAPDNAHESFGAEAPGKGWSARWCAAGTPMAIMLDGNGTVASEVAGGAEQVFALANSHPVNAAKT